MVEKLIRAGHLKRFIREPSHGTETAPTADRAIIDNEHPLKPRPAINYVLGGQIDDQYQSKKKRRKMLRAAKRGGKWRVCIDYMDLNDACPKDSFPLPRIDQIVDALAGYGMLSFLDAFSGYHQIPMYPPDAEKTSFITPSWALLLRRNAIRVKECRGHLPKIGNQDVSATSRENYGSVYR